MSIAFGGAMKDSDEDALQQAMRAMRKIAAKRKRIAAIRQLSKRRHVRSAICLYCVGIVIACNS